MIETDHRALRRRLSLPLLVLYGVGITVGAGIYVLIGSVAGLVGVHAPWAFGLAAIIMALTVASYSQLAKRFPVSAGEAAYVGAAFGDRRLSIFVGLLTAGIGTISAAAVALGSAGYIGQFTTLPTAIVIILVIALLGALAAWGILESVVVAGVFTLIEVGGLIAIVVAASGADAPIADSLAPPPFMAPGFIAAFALAGLLAFFAFIGFEDLANIAEEAIDPRRDLPIAMALTLVISTLLYVAIAAIAVSAVPPDELAASPAPLSLVFRKLTGISPVAISAIAIVATLNTILAQITMAARVLYGMSRQGDLPGRLGQVAGTTGTPLNATGLVCLLVVGAALLLPIAALAEATSVATLAVFALVNLSLLKLKLWPRSGGPPDSLWSIWAPAAGFLACLGLIAAALAG